MVNPSSISGLVTRYRADSVTGVADGAAVASWPDTSGGGYVATQATTTAQPVYVASGIGGKPSIRFGGAASMTTNQVINFYGSSSQYTAIAVMKPTTVSGGSLTVLGSNVAGTMQFGPNNKTIRMVSQSNSAMSVSGNVLIAGNPAVITSSWDGLSAGAFRTFNNGAPSGTGSAPVSYTVTSATRLIGRKQDASNAPEFFQGDIAEILVWNRILSLAELASVDSYVQDRYGIIVADYLPPSGPATLSGLYHWYRADDLAGADGSVVTAWPDRASAGNTVIQNTASKQPILKRGVLGGQDAVRFDGVDDVLVTQTEEPWGPNWTVFAVHYATAAWSKTTGPFGSDIQNVDTTRVWRMEYQSSTAVTLAAYYGSQSSNEFETTAVTFPTAAPAVITGTRTATTIESFMNGASDGAKTTANAGATKTNSGMTIGASRNLDATPGNWNGYVAEVIAYDRTLTTAERATVHSYIQDRYGIAVSDYQSGPTGPSVTLYLGAAGSLSQIASLSSGAITVLSGIGTLAESDSSAPALSAAFSAVVSLVGSALPGLNGTASFNSSGTLSLASTIATNLTAQFSGVGQLAALGMQSIASAFGFSGSASLANIGALNLATMALYSAAGALAANGIAVISSLGNLRYQSQKIGAVWWGSTRIKKIMLGSKSIDV